MLIVISFCLLFVKFDIEVSKFDNLISNVSSTPTLIIEDAKLIILSCLLFSKLMISFWTDKICDSCKISALDKIFKFVFMVEIPFVKVVSVFSRLFNLSFKLLVISIKDNELTPKSTFKIGNLFRVVIKFCLVLDKSTIDELILIILVSFKVFKVSKSTIDELILMILVSFEVFKVCKSEIDELILVILVSFKVFKVCKFEIEFVKFIISVLLEMSIFCKSEIEFVKSPTDKYNEPKVLVKFDSP